VSNDSHLTQEEKEARDAQKAFLLKQDSLARISCQFFSKGVCKKGNMCPYAHIK